MSDWDDIRSISLAVMHELRPYQSYQDIYVFVMRVVNLYDTQIISVLRTFSDVRRLAYFVHEMIEVFWRFRCIKPIWRRKWRVT